MNTHNQFTQLHNSSRKRLTAFQRTTAIFLVRLTTFGSFLLLSLITNAAAPGSIVNEKTGQCLDVAGADPTPRQPVNVHRCHGKINQIWELTSANELRTFGGTRCLAIRKGGMAHILNCSGVVNQKWSVNPDGTIVNVKSGLCLSLENGGNSSQRGVVALTCQGALHQRWNFLDPSDKTPPTPPSGLTVATPTCRSAQLNWAASTDNVAVAFYDIYHDGQQMTSVAGDVLSATVTAVPGALWTFYVNARDAAGNVSQASENVAVRIPQCETDTQPPTAPTQLSGNASGTTVNLQWSAATDNIAVTSYDVYRNNQQVGNTPSLAFIDSGLSPNTNYTYSVAARDGQNNVSLQSNTFSIKTGSSCASAVCTATEVSTDTDVPWGLVTLSDGTLLYSRRDAHNIVLMNPANGGSKKSIGTVPNVQNTNGEGGLLGIAVTPNFPATDSWIYIYHTSPTDNRIVRMRYTNGTLEANSHQVLLSGIGRNRFHNGGRLRFGPDGKLYAATGDALNGAFSQDINNLAGKILRLNPDGTRPADNPFGNYVWSYGHRNPQGLAFDSQGRLWEQEFGNQKQDETNLIQKGGNYGWPACEGTVSISGEGCATTGYIAPKLTYATADASCSGIAIVRDVVYVACLRGKRLYRAVIDGSSLTNREEYFSGTYGRLRTVEPSIDGGLWLTTSNNGDNDSIANNSATQIFKINLGN